jgi:hypothetical protein
MKYFPFKAIVVSRNFNPGHYSHLIANYKMLSEAGIDTFIYQHFLFGKMGEIERDRIFNNIFELKELGRVDLAIFWFPSLKNFLDICSYRENLRSDCT